MQVTLVSFYRNKSAKLERFLEDCQQVVADELQDRFRKYDVGQIHGTVVGLERTETCETSYVNRNFAKFREGTRTMDFDGILAYLRTSGPTPFQLQIGGFHDRAYPFTSRDQSPYSRSFSIQGKNVVVMGWPLRGLPLDHEPSSDVDRLLESRLYPNTLDATRSAAQRFNILHGYHRQPTDTDNDFFFRIGMIDNPHSIKPTEQQALSNYMCNWLSARPPFVVDVQLCDLYVASYESEELPLATTKEYSMCDPNLTGNFIKTLYQNTPTNGA